MAELARILLRRSELGRLQAAVQVSQLAIAAIAIARLRRLGPVSTRKLTPRLLSRPSAGGGPPLPPGSRFVGFGKRRHENKHGAAGEGDGVASARARSRPVALSLS